MPTWNDEAISAVPQPRLQPVSELPLAAMSASAISTSNGAADNVVQGMNASLLKSHLHHIANRRATRIGLKKNAFPRISQMIKPKKKRGFFEAHVIKHQSGGALSWN